MVGDVGFILRSIHSNYLTIMHCFRRLCDVSLFNPSFRFVKDHVLSCAYPSNRSVVSSLLVLFTLASISSLFKRSAVRICNSLFRFPTGVLSTPFISVVLFSLYGLTFSRFFGFTRLSKEQLSFTSPLSFPLSLRCHSRSRDEILS